LLLLAALLFVLPGACSDRTPARGIVVKELDNGQIAPPEFPFLYESLGHPRLRELRSTEKLDQVVARGRTEFEKIVLLRSWARSQWENQDREGDVEPYWDAQHILQAIRGGSLKGGMCSEYSVVLMQACLSFGFQARLVSVESRGGAGHSVVEVWSNYFDKCVVMDPLMDVHYERDRVPLDALELHSALVGARTADIAVVQGEKRRAIPDRETLVDNYFHLTVFLRNNSLSLFDRVLNNYMLSFRDDHTDGRPGLSRFSTTRAQDFSWPLNQTAMAIREKNPREGTIRLALTTNMPDFDRFEIRFNASTTWQKTNHQFVLKLAGGDATVSVRARNILGVPGPAATLRVSFAPSRPGG